MARANRLTQDFTEVQDLINQIPGKAEKDTSAVEGNIAVFDSEGNPVDSGTGEAGFITDAEREKLAGIESGAEVNVQSDWSQGDSSADDYIKNRTHWIEGVEVEDAQLAWTGDTAATADFFIKDTSLHFVEIPPRQGADKSWQLDARSGNYDSVVICDFGFLSALDVFLFKEGLGVQPIATVGNFSFSRHYDIDLNIDLSIMAVHKLDNEYLDMDITPTAASDKPVTSGGVRNAISALNGSNLEYTGDDGEYISGGDSINSSLLLLDEAVDETNGRLDNLKGSQVVYDGEDGDSIIVHGDTVDQCLKGLDDQAAYVISNYQYKINDLDTIRAGAALGATAYQKPSTGIPKSALASAVKTSLEKADTALQPSDLNGYATEDYVDEEVSGKQDTLVSGTNIKTINGESILGSGNIQTGGSADAVKYTEQTLTDAQKTQARTNIAAASESEVSQLRSKVVEKAATTPTNVLYIVDENGNKVLGLEKALLSRAAALFVTDGADGLLRVADAYPSIHADFSVSQGICEIYVRIGKTNKYVKFNYCHDVDTSEEVYKNIWRIGRSSPSGIVGAVFCEYDGVTFSSTGKSALTSLENEFTMEIEGKGDHTGGTHGDERIDLDSSCYIQFIADGVQMDMSSDFHIDCRNFRVIQKSSLHETQEGGTVIAGHPIIAWHTKTTDFADGGYHIRNFIRVDLQNNAASMTTKSVYSGLTCIHKDAATKVWDESGFLFDATGSGTTYWGTGTNRYNHGKTPYTFMANATNKISCEVEAHENGEIEGTLVSNSKSEFTSYADRSSDTKYYCYEPNRVLVTGNRISLDMSVKFNVE